MGQNYISQMFLVEYLSIPGLPNSPSRVDEDSSNCAGIYTEVIRLAPSFLSIALYLALCRRHANSHATVNVNDNVDVEALHTIEHTIGERKPFCSLGGTRLMHKFNFVIDVSAPAIDLHVASTWLLFRNSLIALCSLIIVSILAIRYDNFIRCRA